MRPVIHSVKHPVQIALGAVSTGARENIQIATVVQAPDANLATEVPEGTVIKAVFAEMWLLNDGVDGSQIVILEKVQNGDTGANFTEMAALFTYTNKKNIFFTHQGLSGNDGVGNPIPVIRQWVKIPKSKQRFGVGDRLVMTIANISASDLNRCGQFTYKGYT